MDRAERRKIDYETFESSSSIDSPSRAGPDKLTLGEIYPRTSLVSRSPNRNVYFNSK